MVKKETTTWAIFLDKYIQIEPDKMIREKERAKKVASGGECFVLLEEGIMEKTARNIMKKYFPEFSSPSTKEIQSDFPRDSYEAMVICVDRMCESMVRHLPQTFKTPEDAFKLFQKAAFGKGNWLPLARAIEKTWGIGSFKNFAEIMIFCDYFYSHMGGQPWDYAREAINNFITGKIKQ